MNIIEAIQHARNYGVITCDLLPRKTYLKYIGNGVFKLCENIDGHEINIDFMKSFSMDFIITTSWRIIGFDKP